MSIPVENKSPAASTSRRTFLKHTAGASVGLALGGRIAESHAAFSLPPATTDIAPFRIAVPQSDIDALKSRLSSARLPEAATAAGWAQGVPLDKARTLVEYWRDRYDWRKFERKVNAYPQFRTEIDGLGIHFLHVRSPHANALPMIMTHGWPGSIVEFMKVIAPLTNPTAYGSSADDAFHLVIPSQPGFGFSDKPAEEGWNVVRTATAWGTLMQRLGYTRWVAQGGDWGSAVTHALGHVRPAGLQAAHVNWQFVYPEPLPEHPTPAEASAIESVEKFMDDGYGYFKQQGTRPQTIGYALADSPVGLAMYIYEKFQAWTDNHGNPEDALSTEEMLDNISLYWFTNTAASSARIYWENARHGANFNAGRIELPMAATVFPHEIWRAPKHWAQAWWPNLYYWNEVDHGGHFAAFEQPAIFTDELRRAFKTVRG
ncbi:secreted protein [Paraburkholderia caballeronis]|uniref:epoxide hydrolase family protein n=1 Tax=Paraburkholderia caballeronis TaxID=416943 RepID=UPI0010650A2F|nr:epoxide hydrolase [Paraburkholderia caballeronis]TDV33813.1 secreted protein [Paraburkholderia caballeronis]